MSNWRDSYKKAVTFSYDDGVVSDLHLLEIFNKYGMKCTFNVNTGKSSAEPDNWIYKEFKVHHLDLPDYVDAYAGHEIAVHTVNHPHLENLSVEEVRYEVAQDRDNIEKLWGVRPVGMAYPYGTFNDDVVKVLAEEGIRYSRGVESTHSFDEQTELLTFQPTCHHSDEQIFELIDRFLAMDSEKPQILYIWGHSYEFDGNKDWDRMEKICEKLAGRDDIFYGTNTEVLL